jgi:radical SAM protein with 4Fe4S-binding SPASM domain
LDSLAVEDRVIPGLATLRQRFLADITHGLLNEAQETGKWRFQRALFESAFRDVLKRQLAPSGGPFLDGRSRFRRACLAGTTRSFVAVDGSYYPCEKMPACDEFRIGDVWTGIDAAKAHELKKRYIDLCASDCQRCWCVNFCHVVCYANAREGSQITAESKRKECEKCREGTHRMLTLLFEVLEVNPRAFDYMKET